MTDWCSWWPEGFHIAKGVSSWAYCCYEHDMGKLTDFGLSQCVSNSPAVSPLLAPVVAIMGPVMFAGIKAFGWAYRLTKRTT